jgi:acyl carrier protein
MEPEQPSSLEKIAMAHFASSNSIARLTKLEGRLNNGTLLDDSALEKRDDGALGDVIRDTVAEELGLEVHDIADTHDLSAFGMDSLMSLSILDSLQEKTGLSVPADLLRTNSSIRDIERALKFGQPVKHVPRLAGVMTTISAKTSVEVKTLIGFVFARRKLYSIAKRVLKDAIPEIQARYGPTSWEYGIAVAECAKCCNMTQEHKMGEQLACSTLLQRTGLEGRADSQYLRMALVDSLLAGSNYNDAVEILDNIVATEPDNPPLVLKAAIRLSKVHRRLGEEFLSPKITAGLAHGLQVLDEANDELRSAFVEEIERNVSHANTRNILFYQRYQKFSITCNRRDGEDQDRKDQTTWLKQYLKATEGPPPPAREDAPASGSRVPPRQSLEVSRSATTAKRSMKLDRMAMSSGYVASDVDLAPGSFWWIHPNGLPPVFERRKDILLEFKELTSRKRGTSMVIKEVYVLFQDYSQTVVSATFDAQDSADIKLEQRHEQPPSRVRQDQLEQAHEEFGRRISEAVHSKKDTVVGDGTPEGLVQELLKPLTNALLPVGTRAYGAIVYGNLANASTSQNDEIRPGDVITLRNTKFQGKQGLMRTKYSMEVGKPDHVGIVAEWDGTKKKIMAWEQGRERKKVKLESFKVDDLRSGEVKIWRVMPRSWVGWQSQN